LTLTPMLPGVRASVNFRPDTASTPKEVTADKEGSAVATNTEE